MGKLNFYYNNKKFYITRLIKINSILNKKITTKTNIVKKIKKNIFDIRIKNKLITVSTD